MAAVGNQADGSGRGGCLVVRIGPEIEPDEVSGLCDGVRRSLLASGRPCLVVDVEPCREPDAATVDLLARLALAARRLGWPMTVRRVPGHLADLLAFSGLAGLAELGVEADRHAEEREEALDVEEERDRADPVAVDLDDLE